MSRDAVDASPSTSDAFFAADDAYVPRTALEKASRGQNFLLERWNAREKRNTDDAASSALAKTIVVVTSGGTTAPLERAQVRCVDNFSSGTRGARLVEELVARADVETVMLRREGSCAPHERIVIESATMSGESARVGRPSHALDALELVEGGDELRAKAAHRDATVRALRGLEAERDGLTVLTFKTLYEYLALLKATCETVEAEACRRGGRAVVVLAAAVSDFYVPWRDLPEHKIQSSAHTEVGLELTLKPVPKMLGEIKRVWCPSAFVASFKLETDVSILADKARQSLSRYGLDAVVANELTTRYDHVTIYTADGASKTLRRSDDPAVAGVEHGASSLDGQIVHELLRHVQSA
jgi:phosphopantothenate---cysteine ligase (ATP)